MEPLTDPIHHTGAAVIATDSLSNAYSQTMEELEDLISYDWEGDRVAFFTRARAIYEWAAGDAATLRKISDRVLAVARTVRPPLHHPKLWPLAFLLGQGAHLIEVERDFDGFVVYLYQGRYHAVPAGIQATAPALDEESIPGLKSAPTLELLYSQILSRIRSAANEPAPKEGWASSGPDIPWVIEPGPGISNAKLTGSHRAYNIIEYLNRFWGVPQAIGEVDFAQEASRSRPEILNAETSEQLIALIDAHLGETVPAAENGGQPTADRVESRESSQVPDAGDPLSMRAVNPLTPRTEIAEHTFAKVIGARKLISVVIPYFRKESTVFRCLEALRNQSYELCTRDDIEIIIVDDGTPNETIHERLPEDVHYVWQKKIKYGICRAKNTGAKLSNGRYIAFVDPDVIVGPRYFDSLLRGFAKFGDRVVQTGYVWGYHFEGSPDMRTEFGVWENPGRLTSRFVQIAGLNTAVSRNVFEETLGFDEDLIYGGIEDLLFGFHLGLLPGTAVLFNRDMEVWHVPHPPGGAHLNVARTWEIVKQKWPEFYAYYVENGLR